MSSKEVLTAHRTELGLLYRLIDILLIYVMLLVAINYRQIDWTERYTIAFVIMAAVFSFIAQIMNVYSSWRTESMMRMVRCLMISWFLTLFTVLFLGYGTKYSHGYSRIVIIGWFVLVPVVLIGWRLFTRTLLLSFRKRGYNTRSFAVAGVSQKGREMIDNLQGAEFTGMRYIGTFEGPSHCVEPHNPGDIVGTLVDMKDRARSGDIDVIYIAFPLSDEKLIKELIMDLADTTCSVYLIPDFLAADLLQSRWTRVMDQPVICVYETPFLEVDGAIKWLEDIVLALLVLPLIAVPMAIICILVKITSEGPVLYRQTRYGLGGKPINVLKFRTMRVMEDEGNVTQATASDPRITSLGVFLRRYSLDELPQFFNVLAGQMSVVGPRPHAVIHNEQYRGAIPGYMLRHKVKPGITGWAQVNGLRGETEKLEKMEKRIEYDRWYMDNWSVWLDLRIVVRTIVLVLVSPPEFDGDENKIRVQDQAK